MNSATVNTDLLVCIGDYELNVYSIRLNGNRENNPTKASGNYQGLLVNAGGSGTIAGCYFENGSHHALQTGGEDRYYTSPTAEAHDITIDNNIINWPTTGEFGDCMRPTRTRNLVITNNRTYGGESSIRTNYYNHDVLISNNYCEGAVTDVGITTGLGSDFTITNNICKNALGQHGFEIAGTKRVTLSNNISTGNAKDGVRINLYGPPVAASTFDGYIDGTLIQYPTTVSPEGCIVTGNIVKLSLIHI